MDSIIRGYPIGGFIVWETSEELKIMKIGDGTFTGKPREGQEFFYILDGQQRMRSIFAAIEGEKIKIGKNKKESDFSDIEIEITGYETDQIVTYRERKDQGKKHAHFEKKYISVKKCCYSSYEELRAGFNDEEIKIIKFIKDRIYTYPLSIATSNPTIEVATEIFNRVNTEGTKLGVFDIMAAKTFKETEESKFDLSAEWERTEKKIIKIGYNVKPQAIIQSAAVILNVTKPNEYRKYKNHENDGRGMISLGREEFIEKWKKIEESFLMGINCLKEYGVNSSDILPNVPLLALLAHFFNKLSNNQPGFGDTGKKQAKRMKDLFWRICFSERYSTSSPGRLAEDCRKVNKIISGMEYEHGFDTKYLPVKPDDIQRIGNNLGSKTPYVKSVLCVLYRKGPLTFEGIPVSGTGDAEVKTNKKNFHHFFPTKYLEKYLKDDADKKLIDHVGNIIFLDEKKNKEIGATSPRGYLGKYVNNIGKNKLQAILDTHLIYLEKEEKDGLLDYEETPAGVKKAYEKFLTNRCQRISDEIKDQLLEEENTPPTTN